MLRECYSFGAVWEIEAAVFFLSIFGSFQPCTLYLSHVISYDTKLMAFTKLPALGERSQFLSHGLEDFSPAGYSSESAEIKDELVPRSTR